MWNVGHGDAIRFRLSSQCTLIRDFGRSVHSRTTQTSSTLRNVVATPLLRHGNHVAILSHPHEDHFNGFEYLWAQQNTRVFSRCFIPWLDFETVSSLGMGMTRLSVYLYAYSWPGYKPQRNAAHWLRAAPVMASLSKRLRGVQAGYQCSIGKRQFRFTWPPGPKSADEVPDPSLSAIDRVLDSLRESLPQEIDPPISAVDEASERLFKILSAYYLADPPTGDNAVEDISSIDAILETLGVRRAPPDGPADPKIIQRVASPWAVHKREVDNRSIVFTVDNRILMLSDLDGDCIDSMCRSYLRPIRVCNLLKSSHHGTRFGTELVNSLLSTKTVLHTCGPAHQLYSGPTPAYDQLNPTEVLCTDWYRNSAKWPKFHTMGNRYKLFQSNMTTISV